MRSACFLTVTFIMALFLTTSVIAQTWDQATGIGLTGNGIKFLGGAVDRAALGLGGGLSLKFGASPYVMFDLNANYGSFKPTLEGSWYKKDANAPFRTFLLPVSLDIRFTPVPDGHVKPYFTFGGGLLLWDLRNVAGTDKSFFGDLEPRWGTSVHQGTQKEFVFKGGLGLEIFFTHALSMDLQAGMQSLLKNDAKDNVGYGDANNYAATGKVGLNFYLDYYKDTDKDGIEDKKDADPLRPEDVDGFKDDDGAPDDDNDNDGVPDLRDKAPNLAEDIDGFQDDDGVPDPDNDGDGILDKDDQAPNEAEDIDGFQDKDGAPDADNDGDGILDKDDQCPGTDETVAKGIDTKETKNGYQDDDGCPDTKPAPVQLEKKGAKLVLKGVNFETGSATLTSESYAILDEVIAGLRDNKDVSIEIRGYTDSQGAAAANQKLSERRANTVLQYLIANGIEPTRLKAVGYGEKDPIAPNNTPEGRAQNRRIEFVRTK
ncbi:MAG: OmpA family protein [candidate division KSB1 bacterium]|nr:OmpA family protein [candidate division KSB1 bacterium]